MADGLYFGRDGSPMAADEWNEKLFDEAYRRVGFDRIGPFEISTIWVGLTRWYGPRPEGIFETLVRHDSDANEAGGERYSTESEAVAGHARFVAACRKKVD